MMAAERFVLMSGKGQLRVGAGVVLSLFIFSILSLPVHLILEAHDHGPVKSGTPERDDQHHDHDSAPAHGGGTHETHSAPDHVFEAVSIKVGPPAHQNCPVELTAADLIVPVPILVTRYRLFAVRPPSAPHVPLSRGSRAPPRIT